MVSLQAALLTLAVSGTGQTVLLDFYADWCGPCQQMGPVVGQLAAKGYPVQKVNVDEQRDLAGKYRIGPIPCFVMLVDGQEVAREVGYTSLGRLEQMCRSGASARSLRGRAGKSAPPAAKTAEGLPLPVVELGSPTSPAAMSHGEAPAQAAAADPPAGWRLIPQNQTAAGQTVAGGPASPSDASLLASTVRLRIADANGHSCGSGTIIDARDGQALILTCGHIFRDSQGKGPIEVDLFGPGAARNIPGRLVGYDEKRDVGLLSIRVPGPVAAARVAPRGYRISKGDAVISAGCDHGADPTVRHSHVASLDKYLGPPNLEVDDQPVEGRSGGGLFTPDGQLIGVCNAADPQDKEGLFAALGAIHAQLEEAGLAFVCQDLPSMPKQMPRPAEMAAAPPARIPPQPTAARVDADRSGPAQPLGAEEQAALEEIRRRKSEGAEVICIVRPLGDPQAKSEILVLNRASTALLERLAAEARSAPLQPTSLAVPRPMSPLDVAAPVAEAEPRTSVRLPSPIPGSAGAGGGLLR